MANGGGHRGCFLFPGQVTNEHFHSIPLKVEGSFCSSATSTGALHGSGVDASVSIEAAVPDAASPPSDASDVEGGMVNGMRAVGRAVCVGRPNSCPRVSSASLLSRDRRWGHGQASAIAPARCEKTQAPKPFFFIALKTR